MIDVRIAIGYHDKLRKELENILTELVEDNQKKIEVSIGTIIKHRRIIACEYVNIYNII
jgi:hypothetical protein